MKQILEKIYFKFINIHLSSCNVFNPPFLFDIQNNYTIKYVTEQHVFYYGNNNFNIIKYNCNIKITIFGNDFIKNSITIME